MTPSADTLRTLPSDEARQILWRFTDRYDLQMLVQSSRSVARGPVARLVAEGGRNSHEWTGSKAGLLRAFDESSITAAFLDPDAPADVGRALRPPDLHHQSRKQDHGANGEPGEEEPDEVFAVRPLFWISRQTNKQH